MSANKKEKAMPFRLNLDRNFPTGPGGLGAKQFARWYRREILAQWKSLDLDKVAQIARILEKARDQGAQIFIVGNGGSAATASHMATDFAKTSSRPDKPPLKCLSLTDNVPFLTAVGNDLGFNLLFVRQLENYLQKDDWVILISGSGDSPNILEAARFARKRGAKTIGLIGFDGGKLKSLVDVALIVHSNQYGAIEDIHMSLGHIFTFYLKQGR